MMRRPANALWIVALAALLLAGLSAAGRPGSQAVAPAQTTGPMNTIPACSPPATTGPGTPSPTACLVYECCERSGASVAVLGVSTASAVAFSTAQPGQRFLVLDVAIENVSSRQEVPYNPLYFRLRSADGFQYDSEFLAPEPDLGTGNLSQGDRVRGNIAFEVPANADGLVLIYEPIAFPSYQIRIKLSR